MNRIEFYDGIWVEDPSWKCEIDNGRSVKLGALFRITNLPDLGLLEEDSPKPWLVESKIYPHPRELDTRVIMDMGVNPSYPDEDLIGYMVGYMSGVPFDAQAIVPSDEEADKMPGIKMPAGIEMPLFKTEQEAREFCERKIRVLPVVFGLIGFILDAPVNRIGETGWEYLSNMITGR